MSNNLLFIGSNGHVAGIRLDDGAEVWRTSLRTGGFLSSTSQQDVCVLQHEGHVFAGCYGHLFCLEAATGEVLWQNGLTGLGHNEVTLAIANKSIQFVSKHTHSSS